MKLRVVYSFYVLLLICLVIFSWGLVDAAVPISTKQELVSVVHSSREWATGFYITITILFFSFYGFFLYHTFHKSFSIKQAVVVIGVTICVLFFSYPGFSYDIYNYIATAKVTYLYKENPYVVMPIEIHNEPMLHYIHASNKVALYGMAWILLSALPYYLGVNNIVLTLFLFKFLAVIFYGITLYCLWILSHRKVWPVVFFGLNPLVLIETVVSAHNDIVMMGLSLVSFVMIQKKKYAVAILFLMLSVFIKFATVVLIPTFCYVAWWRYRNKTIEWNTVWRYSAYCMMGIFLLSPLREEIYSWYFIWPLSFIALLPSYSLEVYVSYGFSFGLLHRMSPFLLTREWGGITPIVKKLVTFVFPAMTGMYYGFRQKK